MAFQNEEEKEEAEDGKVNAVGTPDYIAPEVFLGTGSGASITPWRLFALFFLTFLFINDK